MNRNLKRLKRIISIMLLSVYLIILNVIPVFAVTTTYQASTSFNNGLGIQGKDQWYYKEWNGSSFSDLTWSSANQRWVGTQANLVITDTVMHPEASTDAVRKWVAPCEGTARIYGNVKKLDTGGGDGIVVKIMHNGIDVWGAYSIAYNDSNGLNYDFTRTLRTGDAIYFLVNKASTIYNDSTTWDPLIDFTPSVYTYQATTAFSNGLGIQGKDQWYYQQYNGSAYSNLSWNNSAQKWYGTQTYLAISGGIMHPEASLDAVRKWVSPCDGNVRIYGNVKKADTGGGDGVAVKILHNTSTVWGSYNIAYNDSIGLNYDFTRTIKAGDALYFSVNKRSTISNDSTQWDPLIEFTPISAGAISKEWNFTSSTESWSSNWHTTVSASGGYLNATVTGTDPSIKSPNNLNTDITKSCILKIKYKNTTNNSGGIVFFTTTEDTTFTASKSKSFTVIANDPNYTEYIVDMSGVYGWIGKLKQIRLDLSEASSGSYSVDYVKLVAGGENIAPLSLLDKEIIYNNNTLKNTLDLDYYADSSFGIRRNSDASYDFYTANGGSPIGQHSTITHGTLELPASTITYKWKAITGVPAGIDYTSTGPVYQDPTDVNTLISFLHLERHYVVDSVPYFDASIGLAITRNNGSTWTFCGEIIDHDIAPDETLAAGYDIGAGTFTIVNENEIDYFYVYALDHSVTNPYLRALSVSRAPVLEVLNAAKNNTVTSFLKYYNGSFTEPGMNGSFTNIFNPNAHMNFMSISYNTYINKYIMAYTSIYQWGSNNWSDISLLISDSPTDFYNNTKEIIIDASNKYTQYPTIIGLGNDNPQTQSQKNFYVYYMQWANDQVWGSDTNLVRKMIIIN